MAGRREVREARELGAAAERRRLRAFNGVGRVNFPFAVPVHEGVVQYAADLERALIQAGAERLAATERLEDREADLSRNRDEAALTAVLQARTAHEALDEEIGQLQRERLDVDFWLERMFEFVSHAVHAFEAGRQLIRAPEGVEVFGSQAAFVAENSHRRVLHDIRPMDAGGMDFGSHWRRFGDDKGSSGRRTGTWRLSWIEETGEIYATRWDVASELWLIAHGFHRKDEVWDLLTPVERRQDEPNSLLLVTRHILEHAAGRSESLVRRLRRAAHQLREELPPDLQPEDDADAALAVAASVIAGQDPEQDAQRKRRLDDRIGAFRTSDT
jgi:hypothetical protein